jgi:hypothetical protein
MDDHAVSWLNVPLFYAVLVLAAELRSKRPESRAIAIRLDFLAEAGASTYSHP